MVAEMHRIENAARLAMGDHGSELVAKSAGYCVSTIMKIGFLIAAAAVTGLIATNLF
jgi:hypothetical protein